jgi:prepilin-type processing-associated H-X9-DG protein
MIELLVVMAIIAIVASLILPGLTAGREASRRTQCVNNLRQLSLALQNYQTQMEVLPPGVVSAWRPVHNWPEALQAGWIVQLLPYMEQSAASGIFDTGSAAYAPENSTAKYGRISILLCPSESGGPATLGGLSSYAACHHDVEAPIDLDNQGVFFLNSAIRDCDITDGCSSTIFLGEKRFDVAVDLGWPSGTRATLRNTGHPLNAPAAPRGPGDDTVGGFASFHPGGANFAFGDGSVRFLRQTIQPRVFRLFGNRADGEMIGGDEY